MKRGTLEREVCCVFRPVNGCSAFLSLVKIILLSLKKVFLSFFCHKREKRRRKCKKIWSISVKKWFPPANGVCSTRLLVKIHNRGISPKIGIILVQMPLWLIASANTGNCKKNYKFFLRWQPLLPILLQSPNHLSTTSRA